MNNKRLLTFYGLKWNPFVFDVPVEGLVSSAKIDQFSFRVENLVLEGGFAMITGESGTGKSVALRLLNDRLSAVRELIVGVLTRPQSRLADFYRELGCLFGVELSVANRWGGYKSLREKWHTHVETTLLRPVLLIDEAQEMPQEVLSELRFLSSTQFDSAAILTIILCGDLRLPEKFRSEPLVPLGTRIRTRLHMESLPPKELAPFLTEVIQRAGNPHLMSRDLIDLLADHAAGNFRVMMSMADELLARGLEKEIQKLDEKLFLEVYGEPRAKFKKQRA